MFDALETPSIHWSANCSNIGPRAASDAFAVSRPASQARTSFRSLTTAVALTRSSCIALYFGASKGERTAGESHADRSDFAVIRLLSQAPGGHEPDALQAEIRLLRDQVVVAVVVQHTEAVAISERGDDEIDGREPVMPDPGELALRIDRTPLDLLVDVKVGKSEQFVEELAVVSSVPRGIAGFEEKGHAGRDASRLQRVGDLARPRVAEAGVTEPRPGRVVEQQRLSHGRAQPARRTSSAAARSTGTSRLRILDASFRRLEAVSSRSPRSCAIFWWAPRITSSPNSMRPSPSSPRNSSSAALTGGVSVIACRRCCVGMAAV